MAENISISLCGDVLISRRLPAILSEKLQEISSILNEYECRFGNLETTIHQKEGFPEAFPGGSYAMASPNCLKDLKQFGFNLFNTANNHSMDYSHEGLLATIRNLDEYGIPYAGTGKNLSDASAATYYECKNGRVAMLGVTSSFHDSYLAGPQNQEIQGRPGVAPLRHKAIYELDKRNFEDLSRIATITGINNYHDQARKEGYLPKLENLKFGTFDFKQGEKNILYTKPLETDLKRTIDIVSNAKLQADVVVVSIHSHQFEGDDKHNTPNFISSFAHKCIDAGADIIVCHGPHVMRGIEVYKDGVIFHGLGNFILQLDTKSVVGEEEYRKAGVTRQECIGFGGLVKIRSKNGKIGLVADSNTWISYFVGLDIVSDKIKATLYPIEITKGYNGGLPFLSNDTSILKKIHTLSEKWNTKIDIDEQSNRGYLCINRTKV